MTKERCEYCEVSLPAADHECNLAVLRERIKRLQSGLCYEMERNDRLESAAEPPADPIVTCPACQHGFRVSASSPPVKDRFK